MEKKHRIKFVKCSKLMFFNKNTQCIKPPYAIFFIYLRWFNAFVPLCNCKTTHLITTKKN